jgi:hypothetical protein
MITVFLSLILIISTTVMRSGPVYYPFLGTVATLHLHAHHRNTQQQPRGYGASLGGPLCYTHNSILGLFSRTF